MSHLKHAIPYVSCGTLMSKKNGAEMTSFKRYIFRFFSSHTELYSYTEESEFVINQVSFEELSKVHGIAIFIYLFIKFFY